MSSPDADRTEVAVAVGPTPAPGDRSASVRTYASQDLLRALIREAAVGAGLGQVDPSVPFADIIKPGGVVLLKPNWVLHVNHSGAGMGCMVTHPSFVLAALEEVLAARPGRVLIADAPIQSADFDRLVTPEWRRQVCAVAGETPVEILDLRNTVAARMGGILTSQGGRRNPSRFVLFDLGRDSLLEAVSSAAGRFRCTSYDPDDMSRVQGPGVHKFLLCKEPFEVDVILSLPKLKAHAKAGVTAALKNVVGLNGDKNYLPHHRVGGSALGGDCYGGLKPFKRLAEWLLDQANRRIGRPAYRVFSSPLGSPTPCMVATWKASGQGMTRPGGWCSTSTGSYCTAMRRGSCTMCPSARSFR